MTKKKASMTRPRLVNGLVRPKETQAAAWTANWVGIQQQLLIAEILH